MAKVNREAFRKKNESDMRQFGEEMNNWIDTHSEISDQIGDTLRNRWNSIEERLKGMDQINENKWDEYALCLDRDFSSLRSDYQRESSKRKEK
jgi:hypothetical protein